MAHPRWPIGRILGSVMVLIVLLLVSITYYAITFATYGKDLTDGKDVAFSIFVLVVFHILITMMLFSYLQCVFSDPGLIPPNLDIEMEQESLELEIDVQSDSAMQSNLRLQQAYAAVQHELERQNFCQKCDNAKPERTHHCSVCQRCVVKYDHHCPWINNCVGRDNYKYFLLFLGYTFLSCVFSVCVLIPAFATDSATLADGMGSMFVVFFSTIIDVSLGLAVGGLGAFHYKLAVTNETTLESFTEGRGKWDMGRRENLIQIFGTSRWRWFVPLPSPGQFDGCIYPIREGYYDELSDDDNSTSSRQINHMDSIV